jgi:hypothetical protein
MTRDLARTKVNFACSRNDMQLFGVVNWKNLLLYLIEAMNFADIQARSLDFDSVKVSLDMS